MGKNLIDIPQLSYRILADGGIELEQCDSSGNVESVWLHACHVQLLFEKAGRLLPADELSKHLARELCSALRVLADEYGLSPHVDDVIDRLVQVKESLPPRVLPHDEPEPQAATERPEFQLSPSEG